VLRKHGVEQYNPVGERFDPNLHNALFELDDPRREPGTIAVVSKVGCGRLAVAPAALPAAPSPLPVATSAAVPATVLVALLAVSKPRQLRIVVSAGCSEAPLCAYR
jgi:hypothetical protein